MDLAGQQITMRTLAYDAWQPVLGDRWYRASGDESAAKERDRDDSLNFLSVLFVLSLSLSLSLFFLLFFPLVSFVSAGESRLGREFHHPTPELLRKRDLSSHADPLNFLHSGFI